MAHDISRGTGSVQSVHLTPTILTYGEIYYWVGIPIKLQGLGLAGLGSCQFRGEIRTTARPAQSHQLFSRQV